MPLVVAGSLLEFRDRDPVRHTVEKLRPISKERIPDGVRVWLHGASVGEMNLVRRVRDWLLDGGLETGEILVTAQTLSGLDYVDHPNRFLMPYDFPRLVGPLSRRVDADLLLVMETELWPNLFRYHDGRTIVLNGRMKAETFARYRHIRSLITSTLGHCRGVLARTAREGRRFRALAGGGLPVESPGPLKWAEFLDPAEPLEDGPRFGDERPVLVAGSTWPRDEDYVLDRVEAETFNLYLAPRHLDRLDEVRGKLEDRGMSYVPWSKAPDRVETKQVVLVDQFGVLGRLYGWADAAFVGGTWQQEVGGHNVIEAARFGVPVVVGPYVRNVVETVRFLELHDLLEQVEDPSDWSSVFRRLSQSPRRPKDALSEVKKRAERIVQEYQAALYDALEALSSVNSLDRMDIQSGP